MRRRLGRFSGKVVTSPAYLERRGRPMVPADLATHACLRQRSPASGKPWDWTLLDEDGSGCVDVPETMSDNTIRHLHLAEHGFGIAFLPPFGVAGQIEQETLIPLL